MSRNNSIDIAKGLGILLVVLGHNWIIDHDHGLIFQLIFSFHMPLFFLLGGVFLSTAGGLPEFIRNKADTLLKPYLVVLALFGIYQIVIGFTTPGKYYAGMLYGVGSTIAWAPLWFLTSLFVTLIFARLLVPALTRIGRAPASLLVAVLALFLLGAWSIGQFTSLDSNVHPLLGLMFGPDKQIRGLPFNLDLLPLSAAFLLTGYLLREQIRNPVFKPAHLLVALLLLVGLNLLFRYETDLNLRQYGHWLITPVRALSGIYVVISLSVLINDRWRLAALPLAYLGRISLFILIFHGYVEWNLIGKLTGRLHLGAYPQALLGLVAAIVLPAMLFEITRRTPLALFMLPLNKRPRPAIGMAEGQPVK